MSAAALHIRLNGQACAVTAPAPGMTLLAALREHGVELPQLCHDDRLQPQGGCRLCLVEVGGQPRPVASCSTPLAEGMEIRTHTPALEALRRTQLEMLAARYPAAAVEAEPQRPFHRWLRHYGIRAGAGCAEANAPALFADDSHPYLGIAMERCIHCDRCVRICAEVQGQDVWRPWQRGASRLIAPDHGATLVESGCVACGACADTCPTGAIHDWRSPLAAERWTPTTCVYCGVGCQLDVGTRDGAVTQVRPAQSPVNRGHACVKGRYAWAFASSAERITRPLIRRPDGGWREVSWDTALDYTATRLGEIAARHGADAIGVLGSARATNEENYLAQKFARVVLGTNNVDCCARVCHLPSAKAMKAMLGTGAATNHFDDIEQAAAFLIVGCNPTENHPVVGARIRQAVRRGARLVVIDPRRTELAAIADVHLALRPGRNVPLFNAIAATLLEENLVDEAFLAARVSGRADFERLVAAYAPERVADECGVAAADIRRAARLYATTAPAMAFHGLGVTEHLQGTEGVMALVNLALLTGNLGRDGSGINPLRGQNNVQGAAMMGCEPGSLPGAQSLGDPAVRARFEAAWGKPLPQRRGLDLLSMMDGARDGRFKALWAFGYDVYLSLAHEQATGASLRHLEFVIIQDLFLNETARAFGSVFLPAASFLERDGTFMNSDRRVQRIRRIVEPPGEARGDAWILQQLAQRMGQRAGFEFATAEAVWDEVRRLWPAGAGLSYARLDAENLHWPCPHQTHPGTPVLHQGQFAGGPTAALACIAYVPTPEQCDEHFPWLLTTGRTLYHFNAGTMTYRTPNAELEPADVLRLHPLDAQQLGLCAGEAVRVSSRHGSTVLPLQLSESLRRGECFTSFHRAASFVNRLTSAVRDRQTQAPEYKVTAVRIARA